MARVRQLPRLWRYLHHVRTWDPTPRFYAIVTGVGLVVGGAAAAVSRRRWLVAAVPTAAFIATFALAARPVLSRRGLELVREFVDPAGSHRRDLSRRAAALRAQRGHVPIVVPADWEGRVHLAGVGLDHDGQLRSITIAAEPPGDQAAVPRLMLRTRPTDAFDPDVAVMVVASAEDRRSGTLIGAADADLQVYEMPDPSHERVAELQTSWRDTTLSIDGDQVPARLLAGRGAQVAVIDLDDHVIEITAHRADLAALPLRRPAALDALIDAYVADRPGG